MKIKIQKIISIIALAIILTKDLSAQESTSHMSIFNAVESEKNLLVYWGSVDSFPNGLPFGKAFGPFVVSAGSVSITAKVEGFVNGMSLVNVPASSSCAYIVWPSQMHEKDGEQKWKLKITSVPPIPLEDEKKTSWTLIYTGLLESLEVKFNNKLYLLKPEKAVSVGGANDATLVLGEKILESRSVESGNFVFVIYGNTLEEIKAGTIYR